MKMLQLKNLNLISIKTKKIRKIRLKVKNTFKLGSGGMHMIQKMAWNTFKNTGDINTFLELKQIDNIELNLNGELDGTIKDEGNSISRE